jgi:hypothetical protein
LNDLAIAHRGGRGVLVVAMALFNTTSPFAIASTATQTVESRPTVSIVTTVTDTQNRLVTNLTQDDFEILDNDKPQPLSLFQNERPPSTAVVLIDRTTSMTGLATRARRRYVAAKAIIFFECAVSAALAPTADE